MPLPVNKNLNITLIKNRRRNPMKQLLLATVIIIGTLLMSKVTLAGSNDTLIVYANDSRSLDQIINSDTTSSGQQAHSVYKLVSLDTTYIFLGPVSVKSNLKIIGSLGPDGRPPCIQPGIRSDGSTSWYLFVMNGNKTVGVFKNLYLTGLATNNTIDQNNVNGVGALIQVSGDSIKLYVDNVVFEDWPENAISYSGNWDSFFITNCKFRNMISPTQWYSGEALRNQYNTAITDTMIMKYNTILAINAYAACPVTASYIRYFEFSHNSVLLTFQNPFWIFNVTNGKVNDNLFYATWVGGITKDEYIGYWDQLWSLEIGSIIDLDTLSVDNAKYLDPGATTKPDWTAEAKRVIEVRNNDYYQPQAVLNFWKAWDDTAHADSIYTPKFMNDRTTNMFNDKTHWPYLTQNGNISVDPGFGPSIDQVLYNNSGNGVGLFQYFVDIRTNSASTGTYGYKPQSVTGNNWIPQWPLPELADMQYSNVSLKTGGTDGKPIGDPGWFTGAYTGVQMNRNQLPVEFALSNNYPNPFNPSTTVKVSLKTSGLMSLKIYNVLGQLVRVVDEGYKSAGTYLYNINMDNYSSGVYFYTLSQGTNSITKKMILMK